MMRRCLLSEDMRSSSPGMSPWMVGREKSGGRQEPTVARPGAGYTNKLGEKKRKESCLSV